MSNNYNVFATNDHRVGAYVSFMVWKFEDNRLMYLGTIVI